MSEVELAPGLSGEALQAALSVAPFHAWLGLRMVSSAPGRIEIEMPWRDEVVSNPRRMTVHGGVLASLIDLAGMYAVLTQTAAVAATADLHVDYLEPASEGPLRVEASVLRLGRTVSVARAEVISAAGQRLALGRGSYLMRRGSAAGS